MTDHLEDQNVVPVHGRRAFLKRSAVAGLTVAYAVPLIETLRVTDVSAATSPAPGGVLCTRTIGYYKQEQHCTAINALLAAAGGSITLGTSGCATSANLITVTTCAQVNSLMTQGGGQAEGGLQLRAQLLAAKLNLYNGTLSTACATRINADIAAADAFICANGCVKAGNCSGATSTAAATLAAPLADFNQGTGKYAGCTKDGCTGTVV